MGDDVRQLMVRRCIAILVLGGVLPLLTLSVPGLGELLWIVCTGGLLVVGGVLVARNWTDDQR